MSIVAEEHDEVNVSFTLIASNVVVNSNNVIFYVGFGLESGVPVSLDSSVLGMTTGESKLNVQNSTSWSKDERLFFGGITSEEESNLVVKTTLNQIKKITHIWHLNEDQKLHNAQCLKQRGNRLFKVKQYTRALRAYKLGIRTLEGSVSVSPASTHSTQKQDLYSRNILATLLTNSALCLLKIFEQENASQPNKISIVKKTAKGERRVICGMELIRPCILACKKAIDLEPGNMKASFRMAQAFAAIENYDQAISAGEQTRTIIDGDIPTTIALRSEIEKSILRWKMLLKEQNRAEHKLVREAFLRRAAAIRSGKLAWKDSDEDEVDRVEISQWSNDLAENMMSLHEELEAFGETMPEVSRISRSTRGGQGKNRLTRIEDIEFDEDDDDDE